MRQLIGEESHQPERDGLHMKTHSSDHTATTTTNTTAAVMRAMCGTLSRRAHSLRRPLGFLLVFLYFLLIFCRVWSTVATSTDTSEIWRRRKRRKRSVFSVGVSFICPFRGVILHLEVRVKQHRTFV